MKKMTLGILTVLALTAWGTEYKIAVSGLANKYEKLAAEELKLFLEQITPDKYTIVTENQVGGNGIVYLGQTEFAAKNGITFNKLAREELVLKSIDGNLVISGGRPVGTLYGVYELLERLGVYFLNYDVTVLPAIKSLKLEGYDLTKKPSISNRVVYDSVSLWLMRRACPMKYAKEYWRYKLRNRANGNQGRGSPWVVGEYAGIQSNVSSKVPFAHNFHHYVSPAKYFAEHPEYFSMDEKGERFCKPGNGRRPAQLCLTNPDVLRITLDFLRDMIKSDREGKPEEEWPVVYDISAMDGARYFCLCPECEAITKVEGHSGLLLKAYINPIAETIAKEYPGLMIRTFAYSFAEKPPKTVRPVENVIIYYADLYLRADYYRPLTSEFNRNQLELFNGWKAVGARIYLWDYWNMGGPHYFSPPRIETGIDAIIEDIKLFAKSGVEGVMTEYGIDPLKPQMFFALDNYVALQLMYDVSQNPEMLIDRFMKGYYGAAAPEMRAILDSLRDGVKKHPERQVSMSVGRWNFSTPEFLQKTWQLLEAAEAKTSGEYRARVHTEMITPLWEIIGRRNETEKLFPDFNELKRKCRELTMANLLKNEAKRPEGTKEKPTYLNQLDALLMELPCPPKFMEQRDQIMIFGAPNFTDNPRYDCPVIDDADSPTGKAVSYRKAVKLPLRLGVANRDVSTKEWGRSIIQHAPQDEKYHWYCMPRITFGSKTWMHGFNGPLRIDLTSAYRIPAGVEEPDFNVYDVWYSLKFEGPAYVKGSRKENAISIDYVVLTPPGLMPGSSPPFRPQGAIAWDDLEKTAWHVAPSWKGQTALDKNHPRTGNSCGILTEGKCRWYFRHPGQAGEKFEFQVYAKGEGELRFGAFLYQEKRYVTINDDKSHKLSDKYQLYSYHFSLPEDMQAISLVIETTGTVYFDDAAFYNRADQSYALSARPHYQMIAEDAPHLPVSFTLTHNSQPAADPKLLVSESEKEIRAVDPASGQVCRAIVQRVPAGRLAEFDAAAQKIKFPKPAKILYLGDSLTDFDRGFNHTDIADFFLNKFTSGQAEVYNYAVRGEDIQRLSQRLAGQARDRFKDRYQGMFDHQYDIAFIFLGHNDTKTHSAKNFTEPVIPLAQVKTLYQQVIDRLKKEGVKRIILMSSSSSNYDVCLANSIKSNRPRTRFGEPKHLEAFNAVLQELVKENKLEYLDVYNPTRNHPDKPGLFNPNDGVHLSVAGHQAIALEVLRYLAQKY